MNNKPRNIADMSDREVFVIEQYNKFENAAPIKAGACRFQR